MKHFCIVANRSKSGTAELADEIKKYIEENGGTCYIVPQAPEDEHYTLSEDIPDEAECILVLGGDGTFLQASKELHEKDIPLFGINMGSLGFLTMTEAPNAIAAIKRLMADDYILDYRMKLKLSCGERESCDALNDIVISRGGYSQLVGIMVYVNDQLFGKYECDGIIISTPTGSTGYNLSAGGPIVKPNTGVILITPICPHALNARSFVISAGDVVKIKLGGFRHNESHDAYITADGVGYGKLGQDEEVIIERAETKCKMCMLPDFSFVDMLNTKLT